MIYNFNIPNKSDDKTMKLFNKINNLNFVDSHKGIIVITLSITSFVLISLLENLEIPFISLFGQASLLKILFSLFFSLFLFSLYNLFLNENGIYKKLSKKLNCSAYVRNIIISQTDENEDLNGINIPAIDIIYDTNNSDGLTAVLMEIDEEKFKILKFLDNKNIKNKKIERISSSVMKTSIEELKNIDECIILLVCNIKQNKNVNDYIKAEDIDIVSIATESFFVESEDE